MSEFSKRDVEAKVIESIDGKTVRFSDGWCFGGVPADVLPLLKAGVEYVQETQNFSKVTGMATCYRNRRGEPVVDRWLWHKTDAELETERQQWLAEAQAKRAESLARNRQDWTAREVRLPSPLRRRLERFRANGGDGFDADGWGYELVVCELAALYAESSQLDTDAINAYASEQGTSGNQHDYAKALSRHLTDDPASQDVVANSVSALTPLTGDADYSQASA